MRKTKNKRLYERYQAVCLHLEGVKTKDICAFVKRNRQTIDRYIQAFIITISVKGTDEISISPFLYLINYKKIQKNL
ncbi:helix-turn-helix domain-containing protein [Paenibacillus sp. FSL R7-0273]|uniref:helix-turn-helix domain-containing protein n=1 Tax=Paenibacillus sp. FSL R7-0273 TaxID=1536772 RepID=UPI000970C933|nr:helix-turn-helix domain-containing protein [Paenibacillus sp. FSL R7-0273]OMF87584.1 hypothetical protein BK144_23505 [Paenibacillus sp. FSL R7-0273]